jgi:hypothetical protein
VPYNFCTWEALGGFSPRYMPQRLSAVHRLALPLPYRSARKVPGFKGKSGRSKKGGAGTSVRLRKLRGRSTTLLCKRPVNRRAVCFFRFTRPPQLSSEAAFGDDNPVFIGIKEMPRGEGDAGKADRYASVTGTGLSASHW